ncbi:hypothetical protein [Bacillus sp. FJAT-29814]|uniref:hypothetical protein n=1 Tax=Bacillus sp. FJAT-29814 TaxID=1729688 RepID=UPI000836F282|nr:hypothetical protein [Bacillus sp. FJAT-29814]
MTKHANGGGSSDFLEMDKVGTVPPGNWEEQVKAIKDVLERYQYTILEQDYLNQLLPFDADIPTIFSEPPYRVYDALFYWED